MGTIITSKVTDKSEDINLVKTVIELHKKGKVVGNNLEFITSNIITEADKDEVKTLKVTGEILKAVPRGNDSINITYRTAYLKVDITLGDKSSEDFALGYNYSLRLFN